MDSKVKLKLIKEDLVKEYNFAHAQAILRIDKNKDFEIAEPKKFQFVNNGLIKLASPKVGRKSNKQDNNTEGE